MPKKVPAEEGAHLLSGRKGRGCTPGTFPAGVDGHLFPMVGGTDAFLTKFNQSGDRQWTKQLGASPLGIPLTLPTAVSINENGGIFMTGYTDGSLPNNTVSGTTDSYIVKYDSSGNLQ